MLQDVLHQVLPKLMVGELQSEPHAGRNDRLQRNNPSLNPFETETKSAAAEHSLSRQLACLTRWELVRAQCSRMASTMRTPKRSLERACTWRASSCSTREKNRKQHALSIRIY